MLLTELPWFILITGIALVGLYLSNIVFDYGTPQYLSRKIGHGVGGVSYLLCVLVFSTPWYPILLSGGFSLLLGGARIIRPSTFRGVGGSSRKHALAEIYFPLGGTLALLVGWAWLNNPWLAIVPILYMAWGDAITGLIRARVYGKEVKGVWGSVGMLITCLLIATLFAPYWIAVIGAVVATLAEKYSGLSRTWVDDNYSIIVASLLVMGVLWLSLG